MAWNLSRLTAGAALPLALALLVAAAAPLAAQVNTGKVGDAAKDTITGAASGGTQTSGAGTEADPNKPAEGEAAPAAGTTTPNPEVNPLDDYVPTRLTDAQKKALTERILAFMKDALDVKPDVRTATFAGRPPWVSRAIRQNPFDTQIEKPLPFNNLNLPTAPPPPYYPPQGGLERENAAEQFQQFLDTARLVGILTLGEDKERYAMVVFGRTNVRLKVGQEVEQKNYTLKVVDITEDMVRVSAANGELQGLLTLDQGSGKLYSGAGEHGLVIVSGSADSSTGQ